MKTFAAFGCVAVLMYAVAVYAMARPPSVSSLEKSVVRIELGAQGSKSGASGVYVGNGLVITARHVVLSEEDDHFSPLNTLVVETHEGQVLPATVLFFSEYRDFAVLKIGKNALRPSRLDCREPKLDEPVTMIGNPLLLFNWGVAHGTVASDMTVDVAEIDEFHTTGLTINSLPGDSGAPVFDAAGNVLGVFVAGTPVYGSMVSSADICAELPRS